MKKADYIEKIKALQVKTEIKPDGIVSSKLWLHLYYLLFSAVPYDLNVNVIIKAVQQKIGVSGDSFPWAKTWDVLYEMFIVNEHVVSAEDKLNTHNDFVISELAVEVAPFAKELLRLSAKAGITLKLINKSSDEMGKPTTYGLIFGVEIYDTDDMGEFGVVDELQLYDQLVVLGASIGLTWTRNDKTFSNASGFELRPAWAVKMEEKEMHKELNRRLKQNINLLAFL